MLEVLGRPGQPGHGRLFSPHVFVGLGGMRLMPRNQSRTEGGSSCFCGMGEPQCIEQSAEWKGALRCVPTLWHVHILQLELLFLGDSTSWQSLMADQVGHGQTSALRKSFCSLQTKTADSPCCEAGSVLHSSLLSCPSTRLTEGLAFGTFLGKMNRRPFSTKVVPGIHGIFSFGGVGSG